MTMAYLDDPFTNEEKSELQNMILSMLQTNRSRLRKTSTVAIIGTVGVGKSSLINSIATAMSKGRWREHAITGFHGGEAEPVTPYIRMYPQCCREEEHANALIPTLIDVGGLPNELANPWPKVLGLIFSGRVPNKENLLDVHDALQSRLVTDRYGQVNRQMVVDRVVVVGSATAQVPENLLKAVVRAARPIRGINSRDIPIFGVMTKFDMVDREALGEFQEREAKFKSILGLGGAETRYLCCRNYCGANDPENRRVTASIPELDVPILKWMLQICDPHIQPVCKESPSLTESLVEATEKSVPQFGDAVRQFQNFEPKVQKFLVLMFFVALSVFIAVFMLWLQNVVRR